MPGASSSDFFQKVGDPGTATTLSAPGYTIGDTSINVGSTANWPSDTGITIAIDEAEVVDGVEVRVDGTYNVYRCVVATGTSANQLVWARGDGNRNYAAGALTRVYIPISAERENRLVEGILNVIDQDKTLKAGAVDNTAVMAAGVVEQTNLHEKASEYQSNFVASGGVVAQTSGLVGTFSDIVYYISGVRYTKSSVADKTYTASKDTYVDINGAGTVTYVEVANGAASPALTASSTRVAKVATDGSAITAVLQNGTDSLGNKIYNRTSDKGLLVLGRQGGSPTDWSSTGVTNYDPLSSKPFLQAGTIASGASPQTITFPLPFSQKPIVTATTVALTANCYCAISEVTTSYVKIQVLTDAGAGNNSQAVNWIAIGV